jgi:hypothetical protein
MTKLIQAIATLLFGILMGMGMGLTRGEETGKNNTRKECIDHGIAKWECNPITGETFFVWRK